MIFCSFSCSSYEIPCARRNHFFLIITVWMSVSSWNWSMIHLPRYSNYYILLGPCMKFVSDFYFFFCYTLGFASCRFVSQVASRVWSDCCEDSALGSWPLALDPWLLALGIWPLALGLRPLALDPRPLVLGSRPQRSAWKWVASEFMRNFDGRQPSSHFDLFFFNWNREHSCL